MQSFPKSRWLMSCGALLTLMSVSCGPASADKFELVYRATLNEGSAPLSGFIGQEPFPVGTPLTITADFDTSSANGRRSTGRPAATIGREAQPPSRL